jgi:hypothetical protein
VPSTCGVSVSTTDRVNDVLKKKKLSSRMHFAVGALAALYAARCVDGVGQWAWMSGSKTECLGNATAVSSSLAPARILVALMSSEMLQWSEPCRLACDYSKHTHVPTRAGVWMRVKRMVMAMVEATK